MDQVGIAAVGARALRTGAFTSLGIMAVQPGVLDLVSRTLAAMRTALPVLAVVAAVVLSFLARRMETMGRWPSALIRALLAVGWLLAGAVVVRRAATNIEDEVLALVVVGLVLPAKALLRL